MDQAPDGDGQEALGRGTIRAVIWHVMPLLLLAYLTNYLDRINIGFAGVALRHDLNLTATMFATGAGLFFVGYFLFEVPSNLVLERIGGRRWIARIMISWGILSAAMIFVRGPASFYGLRFLLGIAEAGFFPGILFYLVCWFPAVYRARMMGLFTLGIPLSTVIGAPLSGILLGMSGVMGLPGWQWMFMLEGLPAVILGVVVYFHLPDKPADARWLSPAQKQWLQAALAADPSQPRRSHLLETFRAFYDPRVLAMCFIYLGNISANLSLAVFLPTIVAGMGFGPFTTGLIIAIPSAVGVVGLLVIGWLSDHFGNHRLLLICTLLIMAIGLGVAAGFGAAGASAIGIVALCFAGIGIHGMKAPFWALAPLTLASSAAAGGIAWINSVGNLGGFFGPFVLGWLKDHYGGYRAGMFVLAGLQLAAFLAALALRPRRDNKTA
jgi:ACS family tartrate transporter-like MFS transporter